MYTYTQDSISPNAGQTIPLTQSAIKWPEVLSLGALNAAVAISWIAYLEYQPALLQNFGATGLAPFLTFTKALVLVFIPILAGWIADRNLAKRRKYFMIYMIGICATAMVFMVVASMITLGPNHAIAVALPVMIVLWLIGMTVFISPAHSMIESFASNKNLPIVMGAIILITDLIYALEPMVIALVQFFGETLTFIVGGILVLGTGYLFHRVTSDEVYDREQNYQEHSDRSTKLLPIVLIGLMLGLGRAFLVEFIPVNTQFSGLSGDQFSFFSLGLAAIVAFAFCRFVIRIGTEKILKYVFFVMLAGIGMILFAGNNSLLFIAGAAILAVSFGLANVSGLPYAFRKISPKHITVGIGIFLGASAVAEGIFEIYYALN